jgi:ATP phosphoribosyltransferase
MIDGPLILAVPSKGRLQENTTAFFARAGMNLVQPGGARDYRARLTGVDNVEVAFVSASEIANQLASGDAHLGVTGEDLVREQIADVRASVELVTPLGFGNANVVVAVPRAWIDVLSMADLDDLATEMHARKGRRLRIATKYINLTRAFFAEHGLGDYRIVESVGATEGAPAAGIAEAIVDITTSGATLSANNLKILDGGIILRSEAQLAASLNAPWGPMARIAARHILSRLASEQEARQCREVRARTPLLSSSAVTEIERRFDARAPFGRDFSQGVATFICSTDRVYGLIAHLDALGATDILVNRLDAVFRSGNELVERLSARIGPLGS